MTAAPPITNFLRAGACAELVEVRFRGFNLWNSPEIASYSQNAIEYAVFPVEKEK